MYRLLFISHLFDLVPNAIHLITIVYVCENKLFPHIPLFIIHIRMSFWLSGYRTLKCHSLKNIINDNSICEFVESFLNI